MVSSDILKKLLPFTHSDKDSVVFTFFGLDFPDIIITGVISLLVGLSLWWGWKLWRSYRLDKRKIDFLLEALEEYKGRMQTHYDEFCEKLKTFDDKGELYLLWNEFDESLIKSANKYTGKIEYHNSIDAEQFFYKKSLLTHIGTKLYATVPSVLLGIGLIGTFLGLFVGLVQLNMDNTAELQTSMKALIHAAGVKFASSIWGLGLSLLFTVFDKKWENSLESKIEEIQKLVDYAFERRTTEQSLENIYLNSIEQKDALQGLAATLTNVIIESQAKSDGVIGERLDKLAGILENFAAKTNEANSSALDSTIKAFVDGLKEAGANQGKELAEIMSKTTEKLGGLVVVIENSAMLQDERNERLRKDIEEIKNAQGEMLEKMSHSISNSTKVATEALTQAGNTLANSQNAVLDKLISVTDALGTAPKELELIFGRISNQAESLVAIVEKMATQLQHAPKYIDDFGRSSAKLEHFGAQLENTSDSFNKFNSSIEQYKQALDGTSVQLKQVSAQVKQTGDESAKTYENLALQYAQLLDKNSVSIKLFEVSMKTYLDEYHQNTQAGVQKTFNAFDSQLGQFASTLSDAINELNDAVSELADRTRR
jgi:uncharacterized protein YukE